MPDVAQHFLTADGLLKIVGWARDGGIGDDGVQTLYVDTGPRALKMHGVNATGAGLVSNGMLGVDVIRLAGGEGFTPHTHPGDHLLIIVAGEGSITYAGTIYPTRPGQVYMIEGKEPHAVSALDDHVILSVGCPHRPIDSPDRMALVEYREVLSPVGELHCLLCDRVGGIAAMCDRCPARAWE